MTDRRPDADQGGATRGVQRSSQHVGHSGYKSTYRQASGMLGASRPHDAGFVFRGLQLEGPRSGLAESVVVNQYARGGSSGLSVLGTSFSHSAAP